MDRKEKLRRQKLEKERRQRKMINRIMVVCAVVFAVIVAVVAATAPKREKTVQFETPKASAYLPVTETPTPEPTPEPTETVKPYNSYAGDTDRSSFAVDPAIPCGTSSMTDEKIVYLTLDDGPSYLTPAYLDLLDEYGIKATFFVTGQSPEHFDLIREAYDRGHTIGLHTYCHDYATVYASPDAFFEDLDRIGAVVQEQIGYVPCFIRFPGGSANYISHDYTPGIMTYLTQEVQNRGYQYFDWNCSSGDGAEVDDVSALVAAATSAEYDTVVLLSHDSAGKETTLAALPQIIEYYLNNGFEFRPLSRDAYTSHQDVFN